MDMKDIKCSLPWWRKHETMFFIVAFLTQQLLGIVWSQIEAIFFFGLRYLQT
jgi:hypothetical protein